MSENDTKKSEKNDAESPLGVLIGVWSDFAVTTVIMFWIFKWNWIFWVIIISTFAGAVKKTVTYVEQEKTSQSYIRPSPSSSSLSRAGSSIDEGPSDSTYCPQCGTLLSPGLSQCSTCGFVI